MKKEMYLAEYNFVQKCFHLERMDEMKKNNLNLFFKNEIVLENCWVPLAYGTYEECQQVISDMKKFFNDRPTIEVL